MEEEKLPPLDTQYNLRLSTTQRNQFLKYFKREDLSTLIRDLLQKAIDKKKSKVLSCFLCKVEQEIEDLLLIPVCTDEEGFLNVFLCRTCFDEVQLADLKQHQHNKTLRDDVMCLLIACVCWTREEIIDSAKKKIKLETLKKNPFAPSKLLEWNESGILETLLKMAHHFKQQIVVEKSHITIRNETLDEKVWSKMVDTVFNRRDIA